mgnify:CR=1 FL=1
MKVISIIGAGGLTRSSLNMLKEAFLGSQMYIYDESYSMNKEEVIHGIGLVGGLDEVKKSSSIFISIGDNARREKYFFLYRENIIEDNLIHNSATIENNCTIGIANQIYANTYINSYCNIGDNNIINTSAVIEHESVMGSHNYISIGVLISGRVTIGDNCFIGAGAIVLEKITICDDVIIGAGCVVTKDINKSGTYVGVPGRCLK